MTGEIQRIAIVGAGAMGGMYASHFAPAGFDIDLIARGERAERLRAGLTVNGTPLVASVIDVDSDRPVQPADLVIFAVKDRHLGQAIEDAAAVVGPETIILSILNGLDSEDRIAARYGTARVAVSRWAWTPNATATRSGSGKPAGWSSGGPITVRNQTHWSPRCSAPSTVPA